MSVAGRDVFDWLPVFHLSTQQVFRVIRDAGQAPHWAYAAGMSRLSCSFCILASRADLRRAWSRWAAAAPNSARRAASTPSPKDIAARTTSHVPGGATRRITRGASASRSAASNGRQPLTSMAPSGGADANVCRASRMQPRNSRATQRVMASTGPAAMASVSRRSAALGARVQPPPQAPRPAEDRQFERPPFRERPGRGSARFRDCAAMFLRCICRSETDAGPAWARAVRRWLRKDRRSGRDTRLQVLGERVIYTEAPEVMTASALNDHEIVLARRLMAAEGTVPWLTLPKAIADTEDFLADADGPEAALLRDLHEYLDQRAEEASALIV